MQRIGNLYHRVCSFENLMQAHKKAMRGTKTRESYRFDFFRESELLRLQKQLQAHTYYPQPYRYFTIYEPKERQIAVAAYRDRVVHHALVNVLEPIYERLFIYHSYATRKGKGTHKAVFQAQKNMRGYPWFLKCDVRKYFDSIDHQILLKEIATKIKDKELLKLVARIVSNAGNGKSLPIGNLTSQFFANVYLNPFDHQIKRQLKCPAYIRYMDDFVIFAHYKNELKSIHTQVEQLLQQLGLQINPHSSFINQRSNGLSYLGVRIFPATVRVKQENLKRSMSKIKKAIKAYEQHQTAEETLIAQTNSLFAHLGQYSSLNLRKNLLQQYGYLA